MALSGVRIVAMGLGCPAATERLYGVAGLNGVGALTVEVRDDEHLGVSGDGWVKRLERLRVDRHLVVLRKISSAAQPIRVAPADESLHFLSVPAEPVLHIS